MKLYLIINRNRNEYYVVSSNLDSAISFVEEETDSEVIKCELIDRKVFIVEEGRN